MTAPADPAAALRELERSGGLDAALALYDALPAVPVAAMLGRWAGAEVPTGNPLDGMLAAYGWHGKHFRSADHVHPLVLTAGQRRYALDPAHLPLGLAVRVPALRSRRLAAVLRPLLRLRGTRRPGARLRSVEHRGVVTAAMVYDALPVIDTFRAVDADTVLGLMDLRDLAAPYVFTLRREEG